MAILQKKEREREREEEKETKEETKEEEGHNVTKKGEEEREGETKIYKIYNI